MTRLIEIISGIAEVFGGSARAKYTEGYITLTGTTETTLKAAIADTFLDLTSLIINNTSATAVRVDFRDDTGGAVRFSMYIPAGDVRGIVPKTIFQAAVNKNWTAQLSGAVTDVRIFAQFVKRSE